MRALLLKGGRVIDPASKRNEVADVLVADGVIRAVGANLAADGAEIYDAAGKVVVPGLIDMHTHFREPGQEARRILPLARAPQRQEDIRRLRRCRTRALSSIRRHW